MELVLLIVAALAAGAAFAFYWQYSALRGIVDGLRRTADESTAAAQKAGKDSTSAREELARRKAEAADLREKLNELRARQHKARENDKKARGSTVDDLADQLASTRESLDDAASRNDVLAREAAGMQADLARLRDANRKLEEATRAAQAAASRASSEPRAAAPAAAAGTAAGDGAVRTDKGETDELKGRIQSLELQLKESRRKAAEHEEAVKGAKGRLSVAQRAQLLQKSELDLFKEKLVWSEKRVVELERLLFENKLALPERAPSPRGQAPQLAPGILARESQNTGGEGVAAGEADYVPEAAAEAPSAEAPAAAEAPVAAEQPVAATLPTDTAAAPEVTPGPAAVAPKRRAKATDGAAKTE